MVQFKINLKY